MPLWLRSMHPCHWVRNYPVNKGLTNFIIASLAQGHKPKIVDLYTLTLNGALIWRGNWPYGYGQLYVTNTLTYRLPSRKAAIMLRDAEMLAVEDDMLRRAGFTPVDDTIIRPPQPQGRA